MGHFFGSRSLPEYQACGGGNEACARGTEERGSEGGREGESVCVREGESEKERDREREETRVTECGGRQGGGGGMQGGCVALSVGIPLCPYGVAYRRAYG